MSQATYEIEPIHEKVSEHHIFDADFHFNVTSRDLTDYIDNRTVRRKIERYGGPGMVQGVGVKGDYAKEDSTPGYQMHGTAITSEEILDVTKETGADEVLLQENTHLPLQHTRYPVVREQVLKAYNEYLVKEGIDAENGIYGSLFVPTWDVDLALEELDKWGQEKGIVSAQNSVPGYRYPGFEELDPIYERITDLDLPLTLHIGGGGDDPTNLLNDSQRTYSERIGGGIAGGIVNAAMNAALTGLFEKFPDLNIVWGEAGTTWMPYAGYRADEFYQNSPEDVCLTPRLMELGKDYLDKLPSEHLFENTYLTTQPIEVPFNKNRASALLEACQAGRTYMFATDWPHSTLDVPNWVFDNPAIDSDLRERILYKNAHEVYRIPS